MTKFESQQSKLEVSPENEKSKKELKDKLKKYFRNLVTWGLVSFTTLGIGMLALREMKKNKELMRYFEESKRQKKVLVEKYVAEKQEVMDAVIDIKKTKEMVGQVQYLENQFGKGIVSRLAILTKKEQQAAKKEKNCPPKIIGFEGIGFKKESLQKLWSEEYYPKGSINEEVEAIEYGISIPQVVLAGTEQKSGKQVVYFASQNKPKENSPTGKRWFLYILDGRFGHELAHINDWESASDLSLKERIEFLYEVTKRFESQDSFKEELSIDIEARKNLDPQEKRKMIKEWWAEACESYFIIPDDFRKVHPKDTELIEKWLKKQDPGYNFSDAMQQKDKFIELITMNGTKSK